MSVPVDLGREPAQEAVREELAKRVYQEAGPSLLERALDWLQERIFDLLERSVGASPSSWLGLALIAALVIVAIFAVRKGIGPSGRRARSDQSLFADAELTAAEHRARAERHAAAGEWAEAVRERLRAVVRSLEERSILEPRPGRTATEAATEAGRALPPQAEELLAAAHVFEDIWYGERPGTADAADRLRELDRALLDTRPVAR
jgi:hypothetical protein